MHKLSKQFFDRDAQQVARDLLGKMILRRYQDQWLCAKIIETEAYYLEEKGSHASLGFTEKRKALFMPAGTIYMYYARGGDSLNISCRGDGNAVLIKSAFPENDGNQAALQLMQTLNPIVNRQGIQREREVNKLCSGQTLLCKSLQLKVPEWDQQQFTKEFYIADNQYRPDKIIQARRLGIPVGRDEHLLYRFVDHEYARYCTQNPLTKRKWQLNKDYFVHNSVAEKSIIS